MDNKGFIFTLDASIALIIVMVLTASVMVYTLIPAYQGEDHQHLEALADSALEIMDQDGQLRAVSAEYASGNATLIAQANAELNSTLNSIIPQGIGYRITVGEGSNAHSVENSTGTRNLLTRNDVATKVKVISAPQEGWMGRAYYKLEHVEFTNENDTAVTTLWNFHNWLQNFDPWGNQLNTYRYWGGTNPGSQSQTPVPIVFNVPSTGTINWAKVLVGASDTGHSINRKTIYCGYNATFVLDGLKYVINNSSYVPCYTATGGNNVFNYLGNLPGTALNSGNNSFYLNFSAYSSQNMPWFGLIGSYMNTYRVPQGVIVDTSNGTDIAGVGSPTNAITYNLNTGAVQPSTAHSVVFSSYLGHDYAYSTTPFTLTSIPNIGGNGASGPGSAVATTMDVYYPNNTYLYDSFVVVNAYGGMDGALVEVKDANGNWHTAFDSYDSAYSYRSGTDGGYGNIPGIINIKDYLRAGHNTVRVTIWDDANGGDYDLVGLTNCYAKVTYSGLPIRWDCFPFQSYQYNYGTASQSQTFTVDNETDNQAEEALMFIGTGDNSRNITVKLSNGTYTKTLYTGTVPYYLDLGALDRQTTPYILTDVDTDGNLSIRSGTYTLTLSVTPGLAYESGDGGSNPPNYGGYANPEIFSGTRIDIIYPKFLTNIWANAYANTATDAKNLAAQTLIQNLTGYTINASDIKTEALWTGDMPTSTPVRLDLWKE